MHRFLVFFVLAVVLGVHLAFGQPVESPVPDAAVVASAEGPVAVPEMTEQARSYYRSGNVLWVVGQIWALFIPALLLFTGFSARLRNWAGAGRYWVVIIALYWVLYTVVTALLDLPLDYYRGFIRQHAYELSNQTNAKWFGDWGKALLVDALSGTLVIWIPFLLLRKSPRRWWLYTSGLAVPFIFIVMLVQPIWIAPLFNNFGEMKDKALEAKILALADRAGIEGSRVFEVDKSQDTKMVNAYVTGFLGTKRIVLWDTILDKLDEREVLFVMGHEMGHYVLNHVVRTILFLSVLITLSLYAVHRFSGALIRRFESRFGFRELGDVAALPLIFLLVGVISFFFTPVVLAYSRHNERESDRFGLEITRDNHAAASAFAKLQQQNLGNPRPGPLFVLWRGSHPSLGERIDFCNTYKPWESNAPETYTHLFKTPEEPSQAPRN